MGLGPILLLRYATYGTFSGFDFDELPLSIIDKNKDNNGGIIIKVNTAESARPPNPTEPTPRYNSAPAPGKTTRGNIPRTLVKVDMKIGLMRFLVASNIASEIPKLSERKWCNVW